MSGPPPLPHIEEERVMVAVSSPPLPPTLHAGALTTMDMRGDESAQAPQQTITREFVMQERIKRSKNKTLVITGLPESTTEREMLKLFSQYGTVRDVEICKAGRAIVEFSRSRYASEALVMMDGKEWHGSILSIEFELETPFKVRVIKESGGSSSSSNRGSSGGGEGSHRKKSSSSRSRPASSSSSSSNNSNSNDYKMRPRSEASNQSQDSMSTGRTRQGYTESEENSEKDESRQRTKHKEQREQQQQQQQSKNISNKSREEQQQVYDQEEETSAAARIVNKRLPPLSHAFVQKQTKQQQQQQQPPLQQRPSLTHVFEEMEEMHLPPSRRASAAAGEGGIGSSIHDYDFEDDEEEEEAQVGRVRSFQQPRQHQQQHHEYHRHQQQQEQLHKRRSASYDLKEGQDLEEEDDDDDGVYDDLASTRRTSPVAAAGGAYPPRFRHQRLPRSERFSPVASDDEDEDAYEDFDKRRSSAAAASSSSFSSSKHQQQARASSPQHQKQHAAKPSSPTLPSESLKASSSPDGTVSCSSNPLTPSPRTPRTRPAITAQSSSLVTQEQVLRCKWCTRIFVGSIWCFSSMCFLCPCGPYMAVWSGFIFFIQYPFCILECLFWLLYHLFWVVVGLFRIREFGNTISIVERGFEMGAYVTLLLTMLVPFWPHWLVTSAFKDNGEPWDARMVPSILGPIRPTRLATLCILGSDVNYVNTVRTREFYDCFWGGPEDVEEYEAKRRRDIEEAQEDTLW